MSTTHPIAMQLARDLLDADAAERPLAVSGCVGISIGLLCHELGAEKAEAAVLRILRALAGGGATQH